MTSRQHQPRRVGALLGCHPGHQGTSVGRGQYPRYTDAAKTEGRGLSNNTTTRQQDPDLHDTANRSSNSYTMCDGRTLDCSSVRHLAGRGFFFYAALLSVGFNMPNMNTCTFAVKLIKQSAAVRTAPRPFIFRTPCRLERVNPY